MQSLKRLIPNLFTAGNLVGGILAIIFSLTGHVAIAPYCIFISALFDFLDGFMARLLKVPSELGKQLDSLADMVTFGVAPGIIVFVLLNIHFPVITIVSPSMSVIPLMTDVSGVAAQGYSWIPFLALIIPVFALFRLAKFNLDTRQTDAFIGLPTPAMTLFFAVFPLLIIQTNTAIALGEITLDSWQSWGARLVLDPFFLVCSTIVMSVLMIAEIPLFALKFKTFKWSGNELRYLFLVGALFLLLTLFVWALPLIVILYLILSLVKNLINKRGNQTSS
jgi:CDP-diacylglycerol--serine O-phosphatidyltransferase